MTGGGFANEVVFEKFFAEHDCLKELNSNYAVLKPFFSELVMKEDSISLLNTVMNALVSALKSALMIPLMMPRMLLLKIRGKKETRS